MSVYVNQITSDLEGRDIDQPIHVFGDVPTQQGEYQQDLARALASSDVRVLYEKRCKCAPNTVCTHEDNRYYYLFGDSCYCCTRKRWADHSTSPATIHEYTTLDLVSDDEVGSIRDRLKATKPLVKGMLF